MRAATAALCALLSLTGCRVLAELVESDEGSAAGPDSGSQPTFDARPGPDADTDCSTWSTSPVHVDPCVAPPPTTPLILASGVWTFDTNSGALTDPNSDATFPPSALIQEVGGVEVRVLSVSFLEIQAGAELRAHGKRPLLILAWSTAQVLGRISVSSGSGFPGAGSNPGLCAPPGTGTGDGEGASGGGGGGFGGDGGGGGSGDGGMHPATAGGLGVGTPTVLRGGCSGADGGNSLAGAGGGGGGGIGVIARDSIQIDGVIAAGGGGGGGSGGARSGGGGGGSGGMISLQAPTITISNTGVLAANGGAGGGGSDNNEASPGDSALDSDQPAAGGKGEGMGEDGGDGGVGGSAAKPGVNSGRGGGGGGGSVGYIVIRATTFNDEHLIISPDAIQP